MKKRAKSLNRKIFSSSISIVISLSLVLFLIGMLSLLLINTARISNYVKENIGFTIMLKEEAKEVEIMQFQDELHTYKYTQETYFTSKEEATKNLEENLGEDFVDFLGYSPLLRSIDVKLNPQYVTTDSLQIIKEIVLSNEIVHEVYYQQNLVEKLNKNIKKLSVFLFGFSMLLLIISITLINNTIRLSVYSQRFLIRTMHLVGATSKFIQRPFLEKSFYQGIYSAIFAIFLLIGIISFLQNTFKDYLVAEGEYLLNKNDLVIISIVFIVIFAIGVFVNWFCTYLAVRKYIQIEEKRLYI